MIQGPCAVPPWGRALAVVALLVGCSGAPKRSDEAAAAQSKPAAEPVGVACGPKTCPKGQVCCNRSCGICTEPGGFCTMQLCEAAEGLGTSPCKTDADCRAFSDYCTGCNCVPLGKNDPDPRCPGPGVRCLADPCARKKAVCSPRFGTCSLEPR
jgi:hypothetical protein